MLSNLLYPGALLLTAVIGVIVGWYLSYRIPAEQKPNDDATV